MYLLYFIAVVILHVTSANTTESHGIPMNLASALAVLHDVAGVAAFQCVRSKLNVSPDEVFKLLKTCADEYPIKNITRVPKEDDAIDVMGKMMEEKFARHELQKIIDSINNFTLKLFQAIWTAKQSFSAYSPIIVHESLSLLSAMAGDSTAMTLREGLEFSKNDSFYDEVEYRHIIDNVNSIDSNVLNLRFKYFYSSDIQIKCRFRNFSNDIFETKHQALNFKSSLDDARSTIFNWFANESRTADIVKGNKRLQQDLVNITKEINENTRLVIATAGYFYGTLERGFSSAKHAVFYENDDPNSARVTQYNYGNGFYRYGVLADLDAKFIVLPLKKVNSSPDLSVFVIYPNKVGGCAKVIQEFDKINITQLLQGNMSHVEILIPDIRFYSTINLNDQLRKLGMEKILNVGADFFGITNDELHVDQIYQKTLIDIDIESDLRPKSVKAKHQFHVTSSFIYMISAVGPTPSPLFVGQSL